MGTVSSELERAARKAGAEMLTNVHIHALNVTGKTRTVKFLVNEKDETVEARFLLVNFGRNLLAKFTGRFYQPDRTDEGSVFKINMLLSRLPNLKAKKIPATEAFCGTFHSDEGYQQMNRSYDEASGGRLPQKMPCEIYCHTLTDDSILGPELREQGFHTMTLFGLDAPWSLFVRDNEKMRREAEKKYLASINQWLEEPVESCLALARDGRPCIESKSPVDIEDALGMYHGNIFHNAPTFPFAERKDQVGTWGVETEYENVFFCGSSALRGGAVSGIPGHNAAMRVLELFDERIPMPEISTSHAADPRDVESIDAIIAAAYDVISGPADKNATGIASGRCFIPARESCPLRASREETTSILSRKCWMSKSISREPNPFFSKAFTKQKLHGVPNNLAGSLTFGARTNRVMIQAIPRR